MTKRTALITGAGGGLGHALVERLVMDGWRIFAADISKDLLRTSMHDPDVVPIEMDVTKRGEPPKRLRRNRQSHRPARWAREFRWHHGRGLADRHSGRAAGQNPRHQRDGHLSREQEVLPSRRGGQGTHRQHQLGNRLAERGAFQRPVRDEQVRDRGLLHGACAASWRSSASKSLPSSPAPSARAWSKASSGRSRRPKPRRRNSLRCFASSRGLPVNRSARRMIRTSWRK